MSSSAAEVPAVIVQRQLDAYNARDLAGLLALYAENAELIEFPNTVVASGTVALRQRFAARFAEPNLHAALLHRVAQGRFVIDHERVTRTFPEGAGTLDVTMIYETGGDRILRSWAIAGEKRPFDGSL